MTHQNQTKNTTLPPWTMQMTSFQFDSLCARGRSDLGQYIRFIRQLAYLPLSAHPHSTLPQSALPQTKARRRGEIFTQAISFSPLFSLHIFLVSVPQTHVGCCYVSEVPPSFYCQTNSPKQSHKHQENRLWPCCNLRIQPIMLTVCHYK